MLDTPNETSSVEIDTDDLDAFNDLLHGKPASEEAEPVEEKEPEVEETPKEDEPVDEPESEEDEPDLEEEEPDPDPEPKPKKVSKFQQRINELLAKAREAETKEAEASKRLRELELKLEETVKPKTPANVETEDFPTPSDLNEDGTEKYPLGEFDPNYIRDLTRHTIQKEQAVAKEQEQKEKAERQEQEVRDMLQNQWVEKLVPVVEEHEDFLEKTLLLEDSFSQLDSNYSDYLVQTIKSLEHGPEVLYYFANNLDQAQEFVTKGPLEATLALGEINALFKGTTVKTKPKVSNAPPPPQLNKGSTSKKVVAADTDDLDAFSGIFFKN